MLEKQILEMRMKAIDRRLSEIDAKLPSLGDDSYVHQELSSERVDLVRDRNVADLRLREIRGEAQSDPHQASRIAEDNKRREKLIQREIKSRLEVGEAFVAKLESQGEIQQARIHRRALLDIPTEVMREFS